MRTVSLRRLESLEADRLQVEFFIVEARRAAGHGGPWLVSFGGDRGPEQMSDQQLDALAKKNDIFLTRITVREQVQ